MAKQEKFEVEVNLNFIERVTARSKKEAIKKIEQKYIHGRGRLPREYISVREYKSFYDFTQVED